MSPQIRRIIGIIACLIGAVMLVLDFSKGYGIGFRPIGLIVIGAIFLVLAKRGR